MKKVQSQRTYGQSRKQEGSYLQRHSRQVPQTGPQAAQLTSASSSIPQNQAISQRTSHIVTSLTPSRSSLFSLPVPTPSPLCESIDQLAHAQQELVLRSQQIERKRQEIRVRLSREREAGRELEAELAIKRGRLAELRERLDTGNRTSQETAVEEWSERMQQVQEEVDRLQREGEAELKSLRMDRDQLTAEKTMLQKRLQHLKAEVATLAAYEQPKPQPTLAELLAEQQNLRMSASACNSQRMQLQQRVRQLQSSRPQGQETLQAYLSIYEREFMGRQWECFQAVMLMKEQETARAEQQERKRAVFKEMRREAEGREKRLQEKGRLADRLTEQIKEKSTMLLNLYQYE